MADCWWQFGEGKLNYGVKADLEEPSKIVSIKYALCSVIEFDPQIQEKNPSLTYTELYNYLEKAEKDSSQSYLKYLYGVVDGPVEVQSQIKSYTNPNQIRTSEKYSIITGLDDNLPAKDEILRVYIIPTLETSSRLEPGEFITKA